MEAFSKRECRRIISYYQAGEPTGFIAGAMNASKAAVRRVWQRYREEGRTGPLPRSGGHPPKLDARQQQQLAEIVKRHPDAFCRELVEIVDQQMQVRVCRQTMGRWLRKLGITRKKSRSTPPSSSGPTSKSDATSGPIC